MMTGAATQPRLVGDIGGTYTRLALFEPATGEMSHVRTYTNRDYPRLEDVIDSWLQELPGARPPSCCLAVATPPFQDVVSMLNMDWSFSISGLQTLFGFDTFLCINDFEGNAYALPHLPSGHLHTLRPGEAGNCRKLAILGPGTGLGGATLDYCADTPFATASEPGHMGLSPDTDLELELFRALLQDHSDIYAELLISGPGLLRLYRTLADIRGEAPQAENPAQVTDTALAGDSALATEALHTFCSLFGSACGDYALATGSYGGLYLTGGIVPRIVDFLAASDFLRRFDGKGQMAPHLAKIPVHAITDGIPGLIGAAHAPNR